MRLKFHILWFENEPLWVEGKLDDVKEIVGENGFEWVEPKICKKEQDFKGNYDDYDMILMDFKLVNGGKSGQTGGDIINKIRTQGSFTNILFYSQEGEDALRREVSSKNIDGVFCASREDFIDKFEKLFLTNIKKVEDVNNLRGIVMAETADLGQLKEEILTLYDKADCSKKKEITKKVIDKLSESNDNMRKNLASKTENTPFKDLLDILDLYQKSIAVHRINERTTPKSSTFEHSKFSDEIIAKRNLLAHVKEHWDGKQTVLKSEKNGQTLIFSHDEAKKIRKDILKYKVELEKIRDSLKK